MRGLGSYVRGLLSGLINAGWGPRLGLLLDGGQRFPDLPADVGLVVYAVKRRYRGRLAAWEDAAVLGRDVARVAPALFHATTLSIPARTPGLPLVATVHDLIPWAYGGPSMRGDRLRYRFGRARLRSADAVIAVSAHTAADAERLAGVSTSRITVIPEAADPRFHPAGATDLGRWGIEAPYLVYAGALDARKDPAGLAEAWRAAASAVPGLSLVLAGEAGAQGRRLPAGLEGAVRLGHVPTDDLAALLSNAACLVFPSRYEGFGLPVLEAMACGCPVAAYRNSSLPEVAGEVASLVADGDAQALGRAAAAFAADARLRENAARRGIERARSFTWQRAALATAAVYEGLLR